jgi:competence protein ComFC
MNYCLWCDKAYFEPLSWKYVFGLTGSDVLCASCRAKFQPIGQEICRLCGRDLSIFPEKYQQDGKCFDCILWEKDQEWSGVLVKNRSLYQYNEFLKEYVAKFKFRGDAAIVKAFQTDLRKFYVKEYKDLPVIPIPLSKERHYERGFNQAFELAKLLQVPIIDCLSRPLHEKKQSKKSRDERMTKKEMIFEFDGNKNDCRGKSVVIIDDIYTTGATIRNAAKVLREAGAASVSSLTLARG